jgi:predicted transposase/invertase (TIGR01784 family)
MPKNKQEKELYLKPRKFKPFDKNEYSIRRDEVFKIVFGSNERTKYLKKFLESVLHRKITNIVIQNEVSLDKIYADNKQMKLDILAEIDGNEKINVELQNKNEYNIVERGQAYSSGIIYGSLKAGENYLNIPKTVVIFILGYDAFENSPYHEICYMKKNSNNEILNDKITYHYFQLPKFIKEVNTIKTEEEQWLAYLSCQLNKEELEELFTMNEDINEINEIVEKVLASEDIQMEIMNRKLDAHLEFLKRQKAFEDGVEEGSKDEKIQMAKKMKADKLPIDTIIKYTELTKEEIEKL